LRGQPRLIPDLAQTIEGRINEADAAQIASFQRLPPAE
jgi:hypothetical protein